MGLTDAFRLHKIHRSHILPVYAAQITDADVETNLALENDSYNVHLSGVMTFMIKNEIRKSAFGTYFDRELVPQHCKNLDSRFVSKEETPYSKIHYA